MKFFGVCLLSAVFTIITGQDAVVTHFDFDSYPDLSSVLTAEPAQPKLTGSASVIRYSILFSDLVCSIARGKITRVKVLVPSGSVGLDFQIQIWRRNPQETFTLVDTIIRRFTSAGSYTLEDSIDFSDRYMEFNDIIGIWLPWQYPVAAVSGVGRGAMFIARYTSSNQFDQTPPPVGSEEPLSFKGISSYYLALEIELENLNGDGTQVLTGPFEVQPVVESEGKQVFRAKRQVSGPTTHVYSTGVKGDKGQGGQRGATGSQGDAGAQGAQGATGFVGVKGSKGDLGDQGEDGNNVPGATGSTGMIGVFGAPGPQGNTGSVGAKGDEGVNGEKGLVGLPGLQGAKGSQGSKGEQGTGGAGGLNGVAGDIGSPGDVGSQGVQGDTGERGARGPEGGNLQDVIDAAPDCMGVVCQNGVCQQTLVGPICQCDAGYEFATGDNTTCSDIDECLLPMCDQLCTNSAGGHTCSCMTGYTLHTDGRTCTRDVGACTSCGEEDSCELLASGNQCLPTTITVASRGGVQSSRQASSPEEVPIEQTAWVNENWVIIFIVWGIVLTVLTLILGVWLVYENRNSSYDNGLDYDTRSHMSGTLGPHGMILTPIPASNSLAGRYSGSAPPFAQLQYTMDNRSRDLDIYN